MRPAEPSRAGGTGSPHPCCRDPLPTFPGQADPCTHPDPSEVPTLSIATRIGVGVLSQRVALGM